MAYEWLRYTNQGATRNRPISPRLAESLSFLPELGVTAEVFSGGQSGKEEGGPRTGSTRHDHGNAADIRFYQDGRQLDWANEADRPVFEEIVRRGKDNGVTGFGAGPGYMAPGTMHVGFGAPGVWGAGGRSANAPDWLRQAYGAPAAPSEGSGTEMAYGTRRGDILYGGAADDTLGVDPVAPPTNPGGLGGLGGFVQSDGFGNLLTAIGTSLLSSPSNAPLAGVGGALSDAQDRQLKRDALVAEQTEKANERRSLELALRSQGFTADQAKAYSLSPSAANVAIQGQDYDRKLALAETARQRDNTFLQGLSGVSDGIDPYAETVPLASPTNSAPPAADATAGPQRDTATLTRTIKDADDAIAITGSDAVPAIAPKSFGTGSTTVDTLMARRARLAQALTMAPSDDARQNGKIILDNLDKQIEAYTPTASIKEYNYAMNQRVADGVPPERYEVWKASQSKAGANNVTIGAERAYDQTVGKGYGDRYLEIQKAGQDAGSGLGALDIMEQAMSNDSFYSGFGSDQLLTARRAAAALGLDPEGVSDMETFSAQTKGAALAAMGGSLGAGFSNADRSFVEGQVPSIENTPEGNRKLIDINRKLARRKQDIAAFARNYAKSNDGRLDMGFDDALAQWAAQNPLFPAQPKPASGPGSKGGYVIRSVR